MDVPHVSVALLPELAAAQCLRQSTVVVIDVLRATTTMVQALGNGAREIVVFADLQTARHFATGESSPPVLLAGERRGVAPPGFDLGNRPQEFTSGVRDRTIVFTTTNGTRAIDAARDSGCVLAASFGNLAAVARRLATLPRVLLLCAGTDRQVAFEDTLLAGAIADQLVSQSKARLSGDQAWIARGLWHAHSEPGGQPGNLAQLLSRGCGGQNLIELGFGDDLEFAAQVDCHTVVPQLHPDRSTLRFVRSA